MLAVVAYRHAATYPPSARCKNDLIGSHTPLGPLTNEASMKGAWAARQQGHGLVLNQQPVDHTILLCPLTWSTIPAPANKSLLSYRMAGGMTGSIRRLFEWSKYVCARLCEPIMADDMFPA